MSSTFINVSVGGVILFNKYRAIYKHAKYKSVLLIERQKPYALVPPTLSRTEQDLEDIQRFQKKQWFWDQYDLPHGRLEKELDCKQQNHLFSLGKRDRELDLKEIPFCDQLIKACEREIREETGLISNLIPCTNLPCLVTSFLGTDNELYVQYIIPFTIDKELFKKSREYKILWTRYPEIYMKNKTLCPAKLTYVSRLLMS